MNPAFIILIILVVIVLWFLLSFAFYPVGKFIYRIWRDAIDEMNKRDKEDEEEKGNE